MHQHVVVSTNGRTTAVRDWSDAVSTYVGRTPASLRLEEEITCETIGSGAFSGYIDAANLGETTISRLVASPNRFRRRLRRGSDSSNSPLMLFVQKQGSCHFEQNDRHGTLDPGDWCVLDTRMAFEWDSPFGCEQITLAPPRPADPALHALIERGVGRRFDGKTGVGRVVQAMVHEAFGQVPRLEASAASAVADAIGALLWRAIDEQLQAPAPVLLRDTQCARIKALIEECLTQPDLSVETIATECGISVRSVQRAFSNDPEGPVSAYIWRRRLAHCASSLRDPHSARRSITDIALAWGFSSSSHFSRAFRGAFGISPRDFRGIS